MNEFSESTTYPISPNQQSSLASNAESKAFSQSSEINFAQIFNALPELVFISQLSDDRCVEVNQAFLEATGYCRDEVIGRVISELGFESVSKSLLEPCQFHPLPQKCHNQEIEFCRKTGEQRAGLLSTDVANLPGQPCVIGIVRDVTDLKHVEKQLQHGLLHDSLTGIPNRSYFMERLNYVLQKKQVDSKCLAALCFLDLDGFKAINDTFGHAVGDQLLVKVSQRLSNLFQQKYFVARWGGDEFVLLLEQLQDLSDITYLANCIIEAFGYPFELNRKAVPCSISIGISLIPEAPITANELLQQADTAMYQAKAFGKSRYHLFSIEPGCKNLPREQQYSAMLALRINSRLRHSQKK